MPELHLEVSTVHGQCTMDELVRDLCLHFSTSPAPSTCGKEDVTKVTDSYPSGLHLGQTALVIGTSQDAHQPSQEAPQQAGLFHQGPRQDQTPRSQTA